MSDLQDRKTNHHPLKEVWQTLRRLHKLLRGHLQDRFSPASTWLRETARRLQKLRLADRAGFDKANPSVEPVLQPRLPIEKGEDTENVNCLQLELRKAKAGKGKGAEKRVSEDTSALGETKRRY